MTQGLVIKECSLSPQDYEAINDEIHEIFRLVDNSDEERQVQEDLVSKMRGYQEERHALKEAKTVLARSGCCPKELDALLAGVESREAELAKEMQELSEDLVNRGVHYTAQSEPLDSTEDANNETTQTHIAEIDVQGTRKLDGLSETHDAKRSGSQGAEDGNELSDQLITAEASPSLIDDEKETVVVQVCATPKVQDDSNDEHVDREGTDTLPVAHWRGEHAGHEEEKLRGDSSDTSPKKWWVSRAASHRRRTGR